NVPGPREPLYLAGEPLRRAMFWVPQSGRLGLGVSILSYAGEIMVGVASDAGLVPDPQAIVEAFEAELAALTAAFPPQSK
ncbi:MAG TPA: WS/DGAT domain-containing protein, partial [Candidatus Eisenbacteria bacterium]|nr:WS/DGAT domain-containing protein [Candidatus Eisenbacteria bacterium]